MASSKNAACFQCPEPTAQEHTALKALYTGDATEYQQRLALKYIVNTISRAHDLPFVPDSRDQSAFLSGRAFVGAKILKYLNIPIGKLKEENNDGMVAQIPEDG